MSEDGIVATNATFVAFSEGLLRSILDLRAPQQLSLVQQLANEDINYNNFRGYVAGR